MTPLPPIIPKVFVCLLDLKPFLMSLSVLKDDSITASLTILNYSYPKRMSRKHCRISL